MALARDLRDAFEERAAIREHEGGQAREAAEASALAEVAQATGMAPEALRHHLDQQAAAPVLDAEGLPCEPCRACGGGTLWKPAEAPLEGPGWRCSTCEPAPATQRRHAVALPTPTAKVPPIDSDRAAGDLGCTPDQIRQEVETRRRLYASRGIAAPIDQDHAIRSVAQTLGVTEQALRKAMGVAV